MCIRDSWYMYKIQIIKFRSIIVGHVNRFSLKVEQKVLLIYDKEHAEISTLLNKWVTIWVSGKLVTALHINVVVL